MMQYTGESVVVVMNSFAERDVVSLRLTKKDGR